MSMKRETWRDWQVVGMDGPPLLTREQVVQCLQDSGIAVTSGDLRYWEQKGSLPHPIRQRYEGATRAVYPEWYIHLVKLLRQLQAQRYCHVKISKRSVRYWGHE